MLKLTIFVDSNILLGILQDKLSDQSTVFKDKNSDQILWISWTSPHPQKMSKSDIWNLCANPNKEYP
jgi:hypothetical protein